MLPDRKRLAGQNALPSIGVLRFKPGTYLHDKTIRFWCQQLTLSKRGPVSMTPERTDEEEGDVRPRIGGPRPLTGKKRLEAIRRYCFGSSLTAIRERLSCGETRVRATIADEQLPIRVNNHALNHNKINARINEELLEIWRQRYAEEYDGDSD